MAVALLHCFGGLQQDGPGSIPRGSLVSVQLHLQGELGSAVPFTPLHHYAPQKEGQRQLTVVSCLLLGKAPWAQE